MATIPGVSDDELIRTSWGIAVADELNDNTVKKTAVQTMAGPLVVTNSVTATRFLMSNAQSPAVNDATRKDYVDAEIGTRVAVAGDTMTGELLLDADPVNAWAAARKSYVDGINGLNVNKAGDTMSGTLHIQQPEAISIQADTNPYIIFRNNAGTVDHGYLMGVTGSGMRLLSQGTAITFYNDSGGIGERGRFQGNILLIGKATAATTTVGIEAWGGTGRFHVTGNTNDPTVVINATAAGSVVGHQFIRCEDTGVTVGSCTRTAGGVAWNATSDYRLKDDLGPIVDPVGRLMTLQPKHLRWKVDDLSEFDGFLAHEVQAVVPAAVTGAKDAVLPPDHTTPGAIDPQQLDHAKLVPLLTAALQDAHTKIADLTARITALEAA